jgi:hypothetical protein
LAPSASIACAHNRHHVALQNRDVAEQRNHRRRRIESREAGRKLGLDRGNHAAANRSQGLQFGCGLGIARWPEIIRAAAARQARRLSKRSRASPKREMSAAKVAGPMVSRRASLSHLQP